MLEDLQLVVGWLFSRFTEIFRLYTAGSILTGVLALWLLRKVAKLFDKLK